MESRATNGYFYYTIQPYDTIYKIANNTVTVVGQSVYGIEDFGINQDVSNNTITAVANPTGSAYGIAVAILDNSTINDNNIYITVGDLTQNITTDMIHGSNAGIRLHSNSTHSYYCNNVTVNDNKIYFNTLINKTSANYTYIQIAVNRHCKSAWNRCCRHNIDMRVFAFATKTCSLFYTKTMLFIGNNKP